MNCKSGGSLTTRVSIPSYTENPGATSTLANDINNFDRKRKPSEDIVELDLFCLGAVVLVVLGVLQFLGGIAQSISAYPEPFSIFNRFLSELGRDTAATAESRRLFERSTVLLGISLFPFFYGIARAHAQELPGQTMVFCSSGIASALGLMGIGVTPCNRFLTLHIISILLWLIPMLLMVLRPLPGMKHRHRNAEVAARRFVVWGTLAYLPGMLLVPWLQQTTRPYSVWIVMLSQKALIVAAVVWLATVLRFIVMAGLKQLRPR